MPVGNDNSCKYVFVCGLPRSGTSMLGRNVARMENCTGLQETGTFEDEGRYLQDVYPTESECGGAGRFGFDPRAHLTESSPLLTSENVARLKASWHPYWDNSKTIFVEKTPANLLMTRFLQAAFPNSYFIVIRRHPVPVSLAIQKWKVNVTSLNSLFEHWLHCHALFEEDKIYLRHVYELSYEGYVRDPDKYHQEIAAFIGTRVPEPPKEDKFRVVAQWRNPSGMRVPDRAMEATSESYDQKYFERWRRFLTTSAFRPYYRHLVRKYEPSFVSYGYSLTKGICVNTQPAETGGRSSDIIGRCLCYGADACAFCRRIGSRSPWRIKQFVKAVLPEPFLARVRQVRGRVYPDKDAMRVTSR